MDCYYKKLTPTKFLGSWFTGKIISKRENKIEKDGRVILVIDTIYQRCKETSIYCNFKPTTSEISGFLAITSFY